MPAQLAPYTARSKSCYQTPSCPPIFGTGFSNQKIPVFYKFWPLKLPINLALGNPVVFLLFQSYVYVVIYQLYLNCIVLIVLVLISFSHGYSAILAAKLMIKLDLT